MFLILSYEKGDVTEKDVESLFLLDCSRSSEFLLLSHEHKGCAFMRVVGCSETSESSNTAVLAPGDMGRDPGFTLYGLVCRERKLGKEKQRVFLFNRNHAENCGAWAASQAAQELRNILCSPRPGLSMGEACTHSCRCLTMSLGINIFVYMCPVFV